MASDGFSQSQRGSSNHICIINSTDEIMAKGILRFGIPDESVPAEERSLFASPQNKDFVAKEVQLHDFRSSEAVVQGPQGLDVQGFTYLKHKFKTAGPDQLEGSNVHDIYLPEIEQFMKEVTGAKEVIAWSGVVRSKLPTHQDTNPTVQHKKGGEMDKMIDSLPRDKPISKPNSHGRIESSS